MLRLINQRVCDIYHSSDEISSKFVGCERTDCEGRRLNSNQARHCQEASNRNKHEDEAKARKINLDSSSLI